MKRRLLWATGVALAGLALLQVVPYGREHTNPPVVQEPAWPSPDVRALAVRACFDCHSNETRWPWYSHLAPVSWLVQRDTDEGRRALNFSEWNTPQRDADEAADEIREDEMPPAIYRPAHPEARLTPEERTLLADALERIAPKAPTPGR
ncbi:MAG: heme-binding domain-containing protein [Archangium sp.]|nr:heme-binding domain-containing protein [Archangium sp.]